MISRRTLLTKLGALAAALPVVGALVRRRAPRYPDMLNEPFYRNLMDEMAREPGRLALTKCFAVAYFGAAEDIKAGQAVCFDMQGPSHGKLVRQVRSDETAWLSAGTALKDARRGCIVEVGIAT